MFKLNIVKTRLMIIEYVHSAVVYEKYLTPLGEMIVFSPKLENYQFTQPR